MQELPLNGFYSGESRKLSDRRCVNFVPTPSDGGSLSQLALMPTSGIEYEINTGFLWDSDFLSGSISGLVYNFENNNVGSNGLFIVGRTIVTTGGASYSTTTLPSTPAGGGTTVSGLCESSRFASSPDLAVVVGPSYNNLNRDRGYVIDKNIGATAIDLITALGNSNCGLIDVAYFGGRFLFLCNQIGFNAVYYSAIGGTEPNSLDFFAPDTNNETLQGMHVLGNTLYLFSKTKCYLYQVTTSTDLPFRNVGAIDIGIDSPFSKTEINGSLAVYGSGINGPDSCYIISGAGIKKVSNQSIDYNLVGDSVRLFTFSEKGRLFVALRSSNHCFVYENETGLWHERETLGSSTWDFIGYCEGGNDGVMIGDRFSNIGGRVFTRFGRFNSELGTELAVSFPSEDFNGLVEREVITSPFNASNNRMVISEIQPQCEIDYSVKVTDWIEPKISLSVSYDFGNTFEAERSLNIGRAGNYNQETRFFNVGYVSQAFNVKLRVLNPYPTRIVKLLSRFLAGGF